MKKLFIDTNVLIDLIDKRVPFYNDIASNFNDGRRATTQIGRFFNFIS